MSEFPSAEEALRSKFWTANCKDRREYLFFGDHYMKCEMSPVGLKQEHSETSKDIAEKTLRKQLGPDWFIKCVKQDIMYTGLSSVQCKIKPPKLDKFGNPIV